MMTPSALLPRAPFLAALTAACRTVEKRTSIPILHNVLIRPTDDGAEVVATDLDRYVTAPIPGAICDDGFAVTLPAHALLAAVKAGGGDDVAINLGEGCDSPPAAVAIGAASMSMPSLPVADFPALDFGELHAAFDLPSADLRRALLAVEFSMSAEETRYYLNGAYMHIKPGNGNGPPTLRFVATDGHRLARYDLPAPAEYVDRWRAAIDASAAYEATRASVEANLAADEAGEVDAAAISKAGEARDLAWAAAHQLPAGAIIPAESVALLLAMTKGKHAPATVHVRINTTKADFGVGAVTVRTKLVDGTFPDYERVIPLGNEGLIRVDSAALDSALAALAPVIGNMRFGRAARFTLDESGLTVSATSPDTGSASAPVPGAAYTSPTRPALDIGFNARYVRDILSVMPAGVLEWRVEDPGSPVVITSPADPAHLCVQMPMRV